MRTDPKPRSSARPASSRPLAALLCTASLAAACTSWAPPVRSTHYGAPGRRPAGQMELGGGVAGPVEAPTSGGPLIAVPIVDPLAVEAGAELDVVNGWGLGFAGLRVTPLAPEPGVRRVGVDAELGGGLGAGGRNHGNCERADGRVSRTDDCWTGDAIDWRERLAGGGYLGAGLGVQLARWSALFVRARYQWTSARSVPLTHWLSGVAGVQFSLLAQVHLHLAGGYALAHTRLDTAHGGVLDLGLSFTFDVPRRKR